MSNSSNKDNRRVSDRRQADRLATGILLQLQSIRDILVEMQGDSTKKIELSEGQHRLIELTLQDAEKLSQLQLVSNE